MSRLKACFELLGQQKKSALIPFITAGDPTPDSTVKLMHKMVDAGVDIIELGIPFSDPMADGPVIQAADERALAHNVSLKDVIDMVGEFRT
ncbi:MAG: tryptophan synthase alpha chain, partial [Gammaproteobacteria bacterium]